MNQFFKKILAFVLSVVLTASVVTVVGENAGFTASAASSAVSIKTAPTLKAENIQSTSVKLSWGKTKNADSYKLYKSTNNKNWQLAVTTKATSYTVSRLTTGTKYYFKLLAVSGKTKSPYSKVITVVPKVGKVTSLSISNQGRENYLKLTWNKVEEAYKYQIYRSDKQNGKYTKLSSVADNTYEDRSVSNNTVYYYKVRAVKIDGKKKLYGDFSDVTKGISYVKLNTPKIKKVNASYDEITLYWDKQETATGYAVYRKIDSETEYTRIGLTKNNFFTDTDDIEHICNYSYYVKAYTKANGSKTVYSQKSNIIFFKAFSDTSKGTAMDLEGKYLDKASFQVSWKKQKGVSGYEIIYSNDRDLYERNVKKLYVEGDKSTSAVIKKLTKNKKYYVKVRPYKTVGNVNYLFKGSRVLAIQYFKDAAKYYTRNSNGLPWLEKEQQYETYVVDRYGDYVFEDNTWQSNPEEYDYDLYCDVCDKKGCSNRKTIGYYYEYYYCFICKKQIWSNECHPTSHVIYSRDYKGHCHTCGKSSEWVNGEAACAHGGCTQWIMDKDCPYCGKFVKGNTCHTCKKKK